VPAKSRDLGVLLFGLAGLYSLLLAFLGLVQLLMQAPGSAAVVAGRLRIQATFVSGVVSVVLHLAFAAFLLSARHGLADRLLARDPAAGATDGTDETGETEETDETPEDTAGDALGIAAAGVCFLAILLLARVVTALSYGASLLWLRGNAGDAVGWTAGGMAVDLLLAAAGAALVAQRRRVAARLLAAPAGDRGARAAAHAGGSGGAGERWQLPGARFLGLVVLVWNLPELAAAVSVFVKWWWRPAGLDLRSQALEHIPPAAAGVLAGLYLLLVFPAGLPGLWRRLRPPRPARE
jgi:hypothetical protein